MDFEILEKAVELAGKHGRFFLATSNDNGLPHIGAAGEISLKPDGHVIVSNWFCPGTIDNLRENKQIAIVVWDETMDIGYQLLGEVEKIESGAMMNGYDQEHEDQKTLPQVEKKLCIHMGKIIDFSLAPHNDVENDR
ncbi:MAG: pyridoxamine 5'-phosphate oxidase family protein [Candidatus Hodarchaeales archaeon]|jgi:hypothetical protein